MAYSPELKTQALNLVKAGVSITDICKDLKIKNRATLYGWIKKSDDKDINEETIDSLKKQIATLSKRAPTEANSRKIAMLTKSLERLEKKSKKIEKKLNKILSTQKMFKLLETSFYILIMDYIHIKESLYKILVDLEYG